MTTTAGDTAFCPLPLDLPRQTHPYPHSEPHQNPRARAALRVDDVLDVVVQSDVVPALVGLDVKGHLPQTGDIGQVSICPGVTTFKAHGPSMAKGRS